jgi:hypothetical protein
MPGTTVMDLRTALGNGADASSISYTDNGSMYVSAITGNEDADQGAPVVSLLGVSSVDGIRTGINVEKIEWADAAGGATRERVLSMVLRMSEPSPTAVRFEFNVNLDAVSLRSATPVADTEVGGLDFSTILCITKSGGAAILPALVTALPSLVGGPVAYLTAVLAQLPKAAIETAQSVISNCFR